MDLEEWLKALSSNPQTQVPQKKKKEKKRSHIENNKLSGIKRKITEQGQQQLGHCTRKKIRVLRAVHTATVKNKTKIKKTKQNQ
jgi:hypothetical protein